VAVASECDANIEWLPVRDGVHVDVVEVVAAAVASSDTSTTLGLDVSEADGLLDAVEVKVEEVDENEVDVTNALTAGVAVTLGE